mgnify:CR=1 FL=1
MLSLLFKDLYGMVVEIFTNTASYLPYFLKNMHRLSAAALYQLNAAQKPVQVGTCAGFCFANPDQLRKQRCR